MQQERGKKNGKRTRMIYRFQFTFSESMPLDQRSASGEWYSQEFRRRLWRVSGVVDSAAAS